MVDRILIIIPAMARPFPLFVTFTFEKPIAENISPKMEIIATGFISKETNDNTNPVIAKGLLRLFSIFILLKMNFY